MAESGKPGLLRLDAEEAGPELVEARTGSVEAGFKESSANTALPGQAGLRISGGGPK